MFNFITSKAEAFALAKKNPRKVAWTVPFRKKRKKGLSELKSKRRTRRTVKYVRGIAGLSRDALLQRRHQGDDVRRMQREQARRAAKEEKKKRAAEKKRLRVCCVCARASHLVLVRSCLTVAACRVVVERSS